MQACTYGCPFYYGSRQGRAGLEFVTGSCVFLQTLRSPRPARRRRASWLFQKSFSTAAVEVPSALCSADKGAVLRGTRACTDSQRLTNTPFCQKDANGRLPVLRLASGKDVLPGRAWLFITVGQLCCRTCCESVTESGPATATQPRRTSWVTLGLVELLLWCLSALQHCLSCVHVRLRQLWRRCS